MPPTVDGRTRHRSHPQAKTKSIAAVAREHPRCHRHHVSPRRVGLGHGLLWAQENKARKARQAASDERGPRWGLPPCANTRLRPRCIETTPGSTNRRPVECTFWQAPDRGELALKPRLARDHQESQLVGARGLGKKKRKNNPPEMRDPVAVSTRSKGVTHQPNGQRYSRSGKGVRGPRAQWLPREAHGLAMRGGTGCGSVHRSGHARNPPPYRCKNSTAEARGQCSDQSPPSQPAWAPEGRIRSACLHGAVAGGGGGRRRAGPQQPLLA